jgi:hypothetical protein
LEHSEDPNKDPHRTGVLLWLTWGVIALTVPPSVLPLALLLRDHLHSAPYWLGTAIEALAMVLELPFLMVWTFVFFAGRFLCVALAVLLVFVSMSRSIGRTGKLVTLSVGLAACVLFWRIGFNGHM